MIRYEGKNNEQNKLEDINNWINNQKNKGNQLQIIQIRNFTAENPMQRWSLKEDSEVNSYKIEPNNLGYLTPISIYYLSQSSSIFSYFKNEQSNSRIHVLFNIHVELIENPKELLVFDSSELFVDGRSPLNAGQETRLKVIITNDFLPTDNEGLKQEMERIYEKQ